MITYESTYDYLNSKTSISAKITALDTLITSMYETMAKAALNDNVMDYSLDTGQSKIKTTYRSVAEINTAITGLEKLRDRYVVQYNKLTNGSMTRLMDSKNFPRNL